MMDSQHGFKSWMEQKEQDEKVYSSIIRSQKPEIPINLVSNQTKASL